MSREDKDIALSRRDKAQKPQGSDGQRGAVTMLVTQCIVCAVVLLLGLLVRLIGGGWATEAKQGLFSALADNTFADVLFDPPKPSAAPKTTQTTAPPTSARTTAPTTGVTEASAVSGETDGKSLVAAMAPVATRPTAINEQTQSEQRATEFPSPVCYPLESGVLTSDFGKREHPISGESSVHTGWDIAAEKGAPLVSMYPGVVAKIGSGGSYGEYIEMRVKAGFSVIYAHCSRLLVKKGAWVRAGQRVALVGSTGVSTGNHLHVEFLENGVPLDPAYFLPRAVYAG